MHFELIKDDDNIVFNEMKYLQSVIRVKVSSINKIEY